MTGSWPARISSYAATSPAIPAPMTITRAGVSARGVSPCSRTARCSAPVRGITPLTLVAEGAGLVEPTVERGGARVAADQHVLDGATHPPLLSRRVHHLTEEEVGLAAMVFLGVRVHLEVLDLDAVVVAHALVHHLGVVGGR